MKKIKATLYGVCALIIASMATTTPLLAGSADFAGPYISVSADVNGASMNGSMTNSNAEITNGTIGKLFGTSTVGVGWLLPIGDYVLLGLAYNQTAGGGTISLDAGAGSADGDDFDATVKIGDLRTVSIMPMFSVSENSAVFVRVGMTHADLSWTGDIDTSLNSSMKGDTYSVGSRTLYGPGLFIDTEFGVSDFDKWNVYRTTGTGSAEGSPETAFGRLAIGFRF